MPVATLHIPHWMAVILSDKGMPENVIIENYIAKLNAHRYGQYDTGVAFHGKT